jgi:hypothetical protein
VLQSDGGSIQAQLSLALLQPLASFLAAVLFIAMCGSTAVDPSGSVPGCGW